MQLTKTLGTSLIGALALGALSGQALAQDKGSVNIAYVEWADNIASSNVLRVVLEQQGYQVETTSLSAAAMWQAVAFGDADMMTAWLPTTHAQYYSQLEDQVENLGPNFEGTRLGLVVPSYVEEVNSIEDLASHADEFDDTITGIDPGAGIMSITEQAMEDYGLDDLELTTGSDATMTAALGSAIANQQPIVVTGWTPHWMFSRWDLKYLDDPQNAFGEAEQIDTVVREGLENDDPEAYCIFDNFRWSPDEMGAMMLLNEQQGSDPYENAKQWVADHQALVDSWTEDCQQG